MKAAKISKNKKSTPITQFSLYLPNSVLILSEIFNLLSLNNIHVVAVSSLENVDSKILRLILDDVDGARKIFTNNKICFSENEVLGLQIDRENQINTLTNALAQAEINIYYIYSFLLRPRGQMGLVLKLEDNEFAKEVLKRHNIQVLHQEDITR